MYPFGFCMGFRSMGALQLIHGRRWRDCCFFLFLLIAAYNTLHVFFCRFMISRISKNVFFLFLRVLSLHLMLREKCRCMGVQE